MVLVPQALAAQAHNTSNDPFVAVGHADGQGGGAGHDRFRAAAEGLGLGSAHAARAVHSG